MSSLPAESESPLTTAIFYVLTDIDCFLFLPRQELFFFISSQTMAAFPVIYRQQQLLFIPHQTKAVFLYSETTAALISPQKTTYLIYPQAVFDSPNGQCILFKFYSAISKILELFSTCWHSPN